LIAAGLVLGLVVAFGVTLLLRRLAKKKNTPENKQPKAKEETSIDSSNKEETKDSNEELKQKTPEVRDVNLTDSKEEPKVEQPS
ncbi:MAG: hypothetical protein FWE13_06545, partial [Firmicutes bacterium]|nr:hypothetical protein [Bacillota bacterium]